MKKTLPWRLRLSSRGNQSVKKLELEIPIEVTMVLLELKLHRPCQPMHLPVWSSSTCIELCSAARASPMKRPDGETYESDMRISLVFSKKDAAILRLFDATLYSNRTNAGHAMRNLRNAAS